MGRAGVCVFLVSVLAACDSAATTSTPPPSTTTPPRPEDCTRDCRPDESDCATFPYDQLPARCQDICYLGECCNLINGAWDVMTVDCARPAGTDAGIDAGIDGMPDGGA